MIRFALAWLDRRIDARIVERAAEQTGGARLSEEVARCRVALDDMRRSTRAIDRLAGRHGA